ncbi:MAG: PH domain-containing protein [Bryobacterales bacterium]
MLDALKQQIKNVLKIPAEPEAPFGAPGSVRVFQAGYGFFRYRMLEWIFRQLSVLFGIFLVLWFVSFEPGDTVKQIEQQLEQQQTPFEQFGISLSIVDIWTVFEMLAIAGFVVQLPFTFLMVFLDFEYRWYIITDRSLRIREGLVRVEERTMTFSNIQNVSIRQGPLQRFFGISDVEVSTAGGGGSSPKPQEHGQTGKNLHRAYFRGIDNPAEVRDAILVHLRGLCASGLGDPEEESESTAGRKLESATPRDLLDAAHSVLQQTRALRRALG